jgi:hypothetical protein
VNTRRLALVAAPATALGIAVAMLSARAPAGATRPPLAGPPATLRATRLYADWDAGRVADGNLPYAPQYPLWSDSARKRRWIRIPSGAAIRGPPSALDARPLTGSARSEKSQLPHHIPA